MLPVPKELSRTSIGLCWSSGKKQKAGNESANKKMSSNWKIPSDVNLSKVWTEFTSGNCDRFHIQVLDEDWKHKCMELIIRHDPKIQALGFLSDAVSMEALTSWIESMYFCQNVTYGCFLKRDEEKDTLVAVDVLYVRNIRDESPELNKDDGESFKNLIKYIKNVERHIRYYSEASKKCNFLTSFGVITAPDYRENGIENNMIRLRKCIAQALRIEVIGFALMGRQKEKKKTRKDHNYKELKKYKEEEMLEFGLNSSENVFPIKIMGVKFTLAPKEEEEINSEDSSEDTVNEI